MILTVAIMPPAASCRWSGTVATVRILGQMFSMGIVTLVLAVVMGRVQITPETHAGFVTSMETTFVVFAALCLGGIFASLARGRIRP